MSGSVVDYGFYLIQRGEAGHTRGAYLEQYLDSGGIETIGYGTVTRPGYNNLNYTDTTITEEQAIELAKIEMAEKINEKCRSKFRDYDNLLPCYQALILDMAYQGNWGAIQDAMNSVPPDMQAVYAAVINNPNRERAAVRGRAVEMGMLIEQALAANPNADPKMVAQLLAQQMIEQYAYLNGTDCELTKDELALLYRSCMAAYGCEVTEEEITAFALGFDNVASGMCGIGSDQMAPAYTGTIPDGPSYDGSHSGGVSQGYVRDREVNSSYRSRGDQYSGSSAPMPFIPAQIGPNRFEPDSKTLDVSTSDVSPNFSSRGGKKPKMIVLHTTESPSYGSTKSTFTSQSSKVSAHYVIDRDGTIHQYLPEGYSAWHAGESNYPPLGISGCCNSDSIGIEIQRGEGEPLTPEQIASTMALVKDIEQRHGIPPEHVVAHSDIAPGRKADPGDDFPWRAFEREGLATTNHRGTGGTHAQHYNPALESVSSSDCKYYKKASTVETRTASTTETSTEAPAVQEEERKRQEREAAHVRQSSLKENLCQAEENGNATAERGVEQVETPAVSAGTSAEESAPHEGDGTSSKKSSGKSSGKGSGKKGSSGKGSSAKGDAGKESADAGKGADSGKADSSSDKESADTTATPKDAVVSAPKIPGENITHKKDEDKNTGIIVRDTSQGLC